MPLTNIYPVAILFHCCLVVPGIQQGTPESLGQHGVDSLCTLLLKVRSEDRQLRHPLGAE